jgi:alpha-tubulin suppressor-like RCC1 family protein
MTECKIVNININIDVNINVNININRSVYHWGSAASSSLSAVGKDSTPVQVESKEWRGKTICKTACGRSHALALSTDGKVYAWGSNQDFAMGFASKGIKTEPAFVEALQHETIVDIACGHSYSMFLTANGKVYVCGRDIYGETTTCSNGERYVRTPMLIDGLADQVVVQIAAGKHHAAVCTKSGQAIFWGLGADGQMGNGGKSMHNRIPSQNPFLKSVVQVAAGDGHSAALDAQGTLWLWGKGSTGQLGNLGKEGTRHEAVAAVREIPQAVDFFVRKNLKVHKVVLGADFTFAISDSDQHQSKPVI